MWAILIHDGRMFIIAFLILWLSLPALAQEVVPEPASGFSEKQAVISEDVMVVAAHPLAVEAGKAMLAKGGTAVDAAIATQLVLNLVEPQSSGIGGGGFMLHYDGEADKLTSYDGREVAPAGAKPDMFLTSLGEPMDFMEAVRSGKAVGVPGLLAMLAKAHESHGKLPWRVLFQPTIRLAKEGFAISPRLEASIDYASQYPYSEAFAALYLTQDGQPKPAGSWLKNPSFAAALQDIADTGPEAFYKGELAERIAKVVQLSGGSLSPRDMYRYEAKERSPVCDDYRGYRVCGMGPPSSGAITMLQTLGMLRYISLQEPYDPEEVHVIMEAQKRAYADRNAYLADSDKVRLPEISAMLDKSYLKQRFDEIGPMASKVPAEPGEFDLNRGTFDWLGLPSTTHISIVDGQGNAVSMTSSVEHSFGSALMVDGFVLNNQLTDFSFRPDEDGVPIANAVAPGKRPRSSMNPMMVFTPEGKLHMVLGSPGGSSIIPYVTKTLIAVLDWQMPLQEALNAPHFMHKNTKAQVEEGAEDLAKALEVLGHEVYLGKQTSGVHAIMVREDGTLLGAADPRREGVASGL